MCRGLVKERKNEVRQVKYLMSIKTSDAIEGGESGTNPESRRRGIDHEEVSIACADVTGEGLAVGD